MTSFSRFFLQLCVIFSALSIQSVIARDAVLSSSLIREKHHERRHNKLRHILTIYQNNNSQFSDFALMASIEELAHIPYQLARLSFQNEGSHIATVIDSDGELRKYKVYAVKVSCYGLTPFIFVGEDQDNPRIHVVFCGTRDSASILRDFDPDCAGHNTFYNNRPAREVLEQVMFHIYEKRQILINNKSQYPFVDITLAGHSLGGADAQMFATILLEEMEEIIKLQKLQQQNEDLPLAKIHVMLKNSAGINKNLSKKSLELAYKVKNERDISLALSAFLVNGDAFQQAGERTIWSEINSPVSLTLFKLSSSVNISTRYLMIPAFFAAYANPYVGIPLFLGVAINQGILLRFIHSYSFFHNFQNQNSFDNLKIYKGDLSVDEKIIICSELNNKNRLANTNLVKKSFQAITNFFAPYYKKSRFSLHLE